MVKLEFEKVHKGEYTLCDNHCTSGNLRKALVRIYPPKQKRIDLCGECISNYILDYLDAEEKMKG